jgi:hypothetical protein
VFRQGGGFASADGLHSRELLSALPPLNVDADADDGCGSLDDTGLVGELGDSRLCSSVSGNLTEGIMVRGTALTYRSASWTRSSTWLSEEREKRCGMPLPDRLVFSNIFYR